MGSRALSHDSIFIPESGQDPARPVRVFSQENVCDRIKALQVNIPLAEVVRDISWVIVAESLWWMWWSRVKCTSQHLNAPGHPWMSTLDDSSAMCAGSTRPSSSVPCPVQGC